MQQILGMLVILLLGASYAAGQTAMTGTEITKEDYHGWKSTYRIANGIVEARVVTDIGPRIIDVRRVGGDNLLQPRDGIGGSGEAQYMFRGGWRLWIAPERRETTYALDNTACSASVEGHTLHVIGPAQPEAGIRKQVDVTLQPGEPRLQIRSRIKNISDHPVTYAGWSLPVLRPGGRAFVPLDVGSETAFDAIRRVILWSYTDIADPRYRFGNRLIEIDHARVRPGSPKSSGRGGDESKIGSDSAQGWTAYLLDRTLLLKRFAHDPGATYPDGGSTIEIYSNQQFLELEHLGPLTTIQPGEEILLPEDWWLFDPVSIPPDEAGALGALQQLLQKTTVPSQR